MSNHVDKVKQPMHPYQFVWMPHWPALEKNQLSNLLGHHGNDPGTNQWPLQKSKEVTSDISGSVRQCMEINAIDFGILKSDQEMSSRNQRRDRPELFDSTVIDISSLLSLAPPGTESSYMGSHIQHKSVSQCPTELVTSHKILGSSLGFWAPLQEDISGTSSCVSPRMFDLGEGKCGCGTIPTAPSFLFRVEENDNHVRSMPSSKRKFSDTNILKVREHEKCNDGSGVFSGKNYMDNDLSALAENLSRRNNHRPAFREEQYKKMNDFSSINMFSTCAHEANTMRIHTSAEDLGGFTPIYQVSHTFPVMENTDTNLRKKDGNFRDSKVLTRVQENVPNKCYSVPQLNGHGKQGVEILVLSSDSEGNDGVNDVSATEVVSKNASQTQSLEMDYVPDQSSRWIKRLKISDPCNHSVGTKSLRLDETTTNKKAYQFVSRGIGGESSISEPVAVSTGKGLMVVNQEKTPLKAAASSSNDNVDGRDGTKRLHSWIQRWRKSPTATPKNRSEPVVICDPQTCKVSLEESEKKPFSSKAAMALVGKRWGDLKCRYRNEGTYTLWES